MMKLNRKVEYALIALKYMSSKKPGQLTSAKEIADRHGSPFDATSRVLQVMAQNGVLKSEQGPQGGYLIVRDLTKISFFQLHEMILGPLGITKCLVKTGEIDCGLVSKCNIMTPVKNLNSKLMDFLKSLPVAELVELDSLPAADTGLGMESHVS